MEEEGGKRLFQSQQLDLAITLCNVIMNIENLYSLKHLLSANLAPTNAQRRTEPQTQGGKARRQTAPLALTMPRRSRRNAPDDDDAVAPAAAAAVADPTAADPHAVHPPLGVTVEDPLAPKPLSVEDPLAPNEVVAPGGGDPDQAALEAGEEAAAAAMEA